MSMLADGGRLPGAVVVVAAYVLLCTSTWLNHRRKTRLAQADAERLRPARAGVAPVLVAYASQTGNAEDLAWQTGRLLHTAGEPVRVLPLEQLTLSDLAQAQRALFIASTYGEGDPPDNASAFVRHAMTAPASLAQLQFGLLALGDAQYKWFCGFGRELDAWLRNSQAQPLFERIDADQLSPAALETWWHQLGHVASISELPDVAQPEFHPWTLAERHLLNAGSSGGPIHHLEFTPPAGLRPHWESGDLAQLRVPADPGHPRDYSIASLPADGRLHLLVRELRRSDGSLGAASGWLSQGLPLGGTVELRVRMNRNFRLNGNAQRPLVLVGNGSGLAGLRGHLRARAAAGTRQNWLVYGERQAAYDFLYRDEITGWQLQGLLQRLSLAFSRDQDERVYVQHKLLEAADELRAWVARGAAIYVCGSLVGMAQQVDDALTRILGEGALRELAQAGRYRRDVY